ncbi:MAG TPA: hypothetical protein VLT82_16530 [Myxococcaceae bacterium]|nr:hypothetical protein [Myxococcaceae bacterium]
MLELSANVRKHVDPSAPVPLRMMAAKALVPLPPPDMITALFLLVSDADEKVRTTAEESAGKLPDRILSSALRDEEVAPPVLGWFLDRLAKQDVYAEMLILNPSTPDDAVARAAAICGMRTAEIISQNQLRLLRHEEVVRQLCLNPSCGPALIDGVCDFCVRSGLLLADVPQMRAARVRIFGPEAAEAPPDRGPTADEIIEEYIELADENAPPLEEGKRLTLAQRIMKMSIAEKIKLATKGNKEARSYLLRDSNKLVSVAVIRSPKITDGEVLAVANNRAAQDDVLRVVYSNREWLKDYRVKVALTKNPKVPLPVAMKFLAQLREAEVKDLAKNKNVPSGVQLLARKMLEKKNAPKKEEK